MKNLNTFFVVVLLSTATLVVQATSLNKNKKILLNQAKKTVIKKPLTKKKLVTKAKKTVTRKPLVKKKQAKLASYTKTTPRKPLVKRKSALTTKKPTTKAGKPVNKQRYYKKAVKKETYKQRLDRLFTKNAEIVGVPKYLIKSICSVESGLRHYSFSKNDGGDHNHAFGICQVLRSTAERISKKRDYSGCFEDYSKLPRSQRTAKNCPLFDIGHNIQIASYYLRDQLRKYDDFEDAIAAYNMGHLRKCKRSAFVKDKQGRTLYKCKAGQRMNQKYVDKVMDQLGKEYHKIFGLGINAEAYVED